MHLYSTSTAYLHGWHVVLISCDTDLLKLNQPSAVAVNRFGAYESVRLLCNLEEMGKSIRSNQKKALRSQRR